MAWVVNLTSRPGNVVDVVATYTDPADTTIAYSWSSTSKVSQAELDKFVANAKAGLTAYLAQHATDKTRGAVVTAALNGA